MEEKINCPICESKKINFFCEKKGYKLYKCFACQLVFIWPLPSNLADIYQASYFNGGLDDGKVNKFGYTDYESDKRAMEETFIIYLDKISRLTTGRKIFDVGAASGYFLDLARQADWQTSGAEISAYAAKIAGDKGHQIFLGNLENLKIKEKYDAVTMWDVLEHLPDPKRYLKSIHNILSQDGILAINTINRSSYWAKFWGKNWHAIIPPEHLFYYSTKSLKILLEASGFEILEQLKIGKKFTLPYICKVFANRYNFKILIKLFNFLDKDYWRRIYLPLNLRDNIFIIARKIKAF